MKKKIALLLMCLISMIALLSGCGSKVPMSQSPENAIKIKSIDNMVATESKLIDVYKWDYAYRTTHTNIIELQQYLDKYKKDNGDKKYTEHVKMLNQNGVKLTLLHYNFDKNIDVIDQLVKKDIDNYLLTTRMGKNDLKYSLSDEFKKETPESKVKEYLNDNKIEVKELVFPNTFQEINRWAYPMKYTYSYIVKGTKNGKPFETQVTQDFYVSLNIKDVKDLSKGFSGEITYIKDHIDKKDK